MTRARERASARTLYVTLVLTGAALALLFGWVTTSAGRADSSCDSNHACVWHDTDFSGASHKWQIFWDPAWCPYNQGCWLDINQYESWEWGYSAKNRLQYDRVMWLWHVNADGYTRQACLDPGENRPSPGRFNSVEISEVYEHCPS